MRRRTKLSLNPKYILITCIVICCALIFISFRYNSILTPVRSVVYSVITPMQKGINNIGRAISDRMEALTSIKELQEENERLKSELDALSYENKMLVQEKYELDGLRDLYKLDKNYPDYPKVAARVIEKDGNNWYSTFKIDKGRDDGLEVDMNVIAGNGLVGIITEVHKNYSIVRSIIDDKSYVSGMFLKTADTCYVKGDLELMDSGVIQVELIGKDAEIYDGYEVVTSHISPKFFQGILIGYITDIQTDSNNMTKTAYLTPVVDFSRLEEVLIITEVKEPLID